jgi:SAM-dependent methyltransferase
MVRDAGVAMSDKFNRLYDDLAWLWPLWGDPAGSYADWCDQAIRFIYQYSQIPVYTLLNLGCGGGKNAYNLKRRFEVTGVDLSNPMLEQARQLNPECRFLLGDMRDWSLGEQFDAVFIDDAISYMTTQPDLVAVFQNAFRHLRAGGVMLVTPDLTRETFQQNRTIASVANATAKPPDIDVVFLENDYDFDPTDDFYDCTIIYVIRESGKMRIETDTHILGLFSLDVWRSTLRQAGFEVHEEIYSTEKENYTPFVCVKKADLSR